MNKNIKIISSFLVLFFVVSFYFSSKVSADSFGANTTSNGAVNISAGTSGTINAGTNNLSGGVVGAGGGIVSGGTVNASLSGSSSSSNKATSCNAPKDIGTLFDYARCLLSSSVIPFVIGLGVLLFLIGVVQYVASGDNEEKREASRNMMIYGVIAIFVMVSVWGFVKILTTTFGFDFALPTLPPSKNNPALNS